MAVAMAFGARRVLRRLGSSVARPGLGERSAVHNFFVAFYVTANSARFFKPRRGAALRAALLQVRVLTLALNDARRYGTPSRAF